jgi:hypothetical protein
MKTIDGYVPNRLIPPSNGFGDYIELHVADDGTLTNWYQEKDISFGEFD